MTKPKTTLAMYLLHQFLSAAKSSGIDGAEMREAMEWVLERPKGTTNPSEALTKVEKLKAEVEKLQQQLIAEAKKTAEEKLRADQLDKQHTMQSQMLREALRRTQELEAQASAVPLAIPKGWKLVPEDANRSMLESGKKVLASPACTPGLTAQGVYKAMLYAAPLPPAESSATPAGGVIQMILDQEAKKNQLIAEGICPTCKGEGECGGQFQGGEWTCESCNGTGRYAPDGSAGI